MIHLRIDDEIENSNRRFACGIGPELPPGDIYYFYNDAMANVKVDCPGCNPNPRQIGTPISEISGRPRQDGYAEFVRIAKSWGFD